MYKPKTIKANDKPLFLVPIMLLFMDWYMDWYGNLMYNRDRYCHLFDMVHRYWDRYFLNVVHRNRNRHRHLLNVMHWYVYLLYVSMMNCVHFVRHMYNVMLTEITQLFYMLLPCTYSISFIIYFITPNKPHNSQRDRILENSF